MRLQIAIKMLAPTLWSMESPTRPNGSENPTLSNFFQIRVHLRDTERVYLPISDEHGPKTRSARLGPCGAPCSPCSSMGCSSAGRREASGNPIHQKLGSRPPTGTCEGKEVRFGVFNSALFATITTDASCGAVGTPWSTRSRPSADSLPLFQHRDGRSDLWRCRRGPLWHA